jgi:hypothetical protein
MGPKTGPSSAPRSENGARRLPFSERGDDCYETPDVAIKALLRVERLPHAIWEPARGSGNVVRVLRAAGHRVFATGRRRFRQPPLRLIWRLRANHWRGIANPAQALQRLRDCPILRPMPSSQMNAPFIVGRWRRRTNVWREVTSPRTGPERPIDRRAMAHRAQSTNGVNHD